MMTRGRSIFCTASAAILYGMEPALISQAYNYGGNSFSVTAYVAVGGVLFFSIILLIKRISFRLPWRMAIKLLTLTSFGAFATSALLYYSYMRISPGIAASLHYIYPVAIAIILAVFFREKITPYVFVSVILSVLGIALISGFSLEQDGTDIVGVLAAVASGVCWGFYIVYMEKSGLSGYDSRVVNFYICLITVPESLILAFATGNMKPIQFPAGWLYILLIVFVGRILAGPLLQKGIHGAGAMIAGVLETLEPVTALLISVLLRQDSMNVNKIVGAVLVICASLIISLQKNNRSKAKGFEYD